MSMPPHVRKCFAERELWNQLRAQTNSPGQPENRVANVFQHDKTNWDSISTKSTKNKKITISIQDFSDLFSSMTSWNKNWVVYSPIITPITHRNFRTGPERTLSTCWVAWAVGDPCLPQIHPMNFGNNICFWKWRHDQGIPMADGMFQTTCAC